MFKDKHSFNSFRFYFLFICLIIFPKTKIYISDFQSEKLLGSHLLASNRNIMNDSENTTCANETFVIGFRKGQDE
jgi:hypothetical protein